MLEILKMMLKKYSKDPLYRNSLFIIFTSLTGAGFGFLFWLIAAKLYPTEDVGNATALVSSMVLIVLVTRLGLDISLVRFFPERDKSKIFSTCINLTSAFTIILGIIFVLSAHIWVAHLIDYNNAFVFIIFLLTSSIFSIISNSFVAMRMAKFNFILCLIVSIRIIFLIPLVFLGPIGIFGAYGLSFIVSVVISFVILNRMGIKFEMNLDKDFLSDSFRYSVGNYIVNILATAPSLVLPIMVVNTLGPEQAAYYYVAFTMASMIFTIPNSVSMSLLVEGSHGERLKTAARKSMYTIFLFLIPITSILFFTGERFLGIIGYNYIQGLDLLKMLILSSFFVAIVNIYFTILRIQKVINRLIFASGLIFILIMSSSYVLIQIYGITGVGFAWLISYGVGSLVIGIIISKNKYNISRNL